MPLQSGKSRSVVSSNIRELHSGKTYAHTAAKFGKQKANKQAIAIALSQARKSRAFGGASSAPMMPTSATPATSPIALPTPTTPMVAPATLTAPAPLSSAPIATTFGNGTGVAAPVVGAAPPVAPTPPIAVPTPNLAQPQPARPWGLKTGGRAAGGAGSFNMAEAPHVGMTGPAAYPARAMMRNMTRGALLTSTPGRADAHRTFVPSGSYVIPADVVSGRGQGNTLNGAGVLQHMFGMSGPYGAAGSGPYGAGMPKMGGGKGARSMMPKPPKIQTSILSASGGGKEGEDQSLGTPVPVNLSGGEIVVPPEHLIATFRRIFPGKNYTLKQIHAMMDKWVLDERQRHRKTLAKLPGPAKD